MDFEKELSRKEIKELTGYLKEYGLEWTLGTISPLTALPRQE
jgi:hypothetical protein